MISFGTDFWVGSRSEGTFWMEIYNDMLRKYMNKLQAVWWTHKKGFATAAEKLIPRV